MYTSSAMVMRTAYASLSFCTTQYDTSESVAGQTARRPTLHSPQTLSNARTRRLASGP